MKYVLNEKEYDELCNDGNKYDEGFNDMWNMIKNEIDTYYYKQGKTDIGVITILESIKDRFKLHYNNFYQDPNLMR